MSKGFEGAVLKLLGAKEHALTVRSVDRTDPHFIRVNFHSATLLAEDGEQPGNWVRAWFPDPQGGKKQFQRAYTLLEANPAEGTFSFDFLIHNPAGPASTWAQHCQPGDSISGMRYGEHYFELLDPPPAGYLLLGDLSSYPAISHIAATIPSAIPVTIFMEASPDQESLPPLPTGANIESEWVTGTRATGEQREVLVEKIAAQDWSNWYAWATAESLSTRKLKTALRKDHSFSKERMYTLAYWVRGRSMGKSRGGSQ